MKDPFSDVTMPLILGSNCVVCGKCVCVSAVSLNINDVYMYG